MLRRLVSLAVLLALAACDSGSSSAPIPPAQPSPPAIVPGPGWPALPPGVGSVEIEMEGTWEITGVTNFIWEPSSWVTRDDPVGQMFRIGPHETVAEHVELVDFAWFQPIPTGSNNNEGDGKFLLFSYLSFFGNSPGGIGGVTLSAAMSIGSAGPDTLVGRYHEMGRTSGFISEFELDFEFTAERR